jgi:hypothetical protein
MRAVTLDALIAVIERRKLEAVNDEYQITDEMIAEAAAIDEARGNRSMSLEELEDLKAAIEGRPNSGDWEEVEEVKDFYERSYDKLIDDAVRTAIKPRKRPS